MNAPEYTTESGFPLDPVHETSSPSSIWSRANSAEALPGVATPLGWTVWSSTEPSIRRAFHAMGILSKSEIEPEASERFLHVFYGRASVRVEFLCQLGDRIPGTSGAAVARQILSSVPSGLESKAQWRYYPRVGTRLPLAMVRAPKWLLRARQPTEAWWRSEIAEIPNTGCDEAINRFDVAVRRFQENLFLQTLATFTCVQPVFDQLNRLVARYGDGGDGLMSGYGGHEESRLIQDLWSCSRGGLEFADFLLHHGYHGPLEGEIASRVWREAPAPIMALLDGYRAMPPEADPRLAETNRVHERARAERALLAKIPRQRRGYARAILALAPRCLPLRGVGKVMFLQSLDVARAAARRVGQCMALTGELEDPEDIFFLTADEITGGNIQAAAERVSERRERHTTYRDLELPSSWVGRAQPIAAEAAPEEVPTIIHGTGASPGIVEGPVRLVLDPADTEFEQGDILVGHTTDPSWAAVLFLSSALVVDIGGTLSHAAVVAREIGVPCVVNTRTGTQVLRTGDWCRVDGTSGSVEILERSRETRKD